MDEVIAPEEGVVVEEGTTEETPVVEAGEEAAA